MARKITGNLKCRIHLALLLAINGVVVVLHRDKRGEPVVDGVICQHVQVSLVLSGLESDNETDSASGELGEKLSRYDNHVDKMKTDIGRRSRTTFRCSARIRPEQCHAALASIPQFSIYRFTMVYDTSVGLLTVSEIGVFLSKRWPGGRVS